MTHMSHTKTRIKAALTVLLAFILVVCAITVLLSVTEAKYVGELNRFEMGVAQPFYFTSNYLSSTSSGNSGNTYNIQGWNGEPYTLHLDMRNYANSLLFNKADVPVKFGFGIRITSDSTHRNDYTVTITPDEGVTPLGANEFLFPENWTEKQITSKDAYEIAGSDTEPRSAGFTVTITPNGEDHKLDTATDERDQIQFEIFAVTDTHQTYLVELYAKFNLRVSDEVSFIGQKTEQNLPSMITLNVTTNNVNDGSIEKIVVFHWDPEYLYINEFQSTAFSVINNNPGNFNREEGYLYMTMQAYSSVELEFFKKKAFTPGTQGAIVVEVVDAVGDKPTASPETASPTEAVTPPEGA